MPQDLSTRLSTGLDGLDTILRGGLIPHRSYMLRGDAGSGKTILGLHFLQAGLEADETVLFINLEEDLADLQANAASLGFDTDSIAFLDLSPTAEVFTEDQSYDIFAAAEVEQEPLTAEIVETVSSVDPDRVVVDPVTQLRYLTSGEYQFRKQIVGLMRFLEDHGATVVFTVQQTADRPTEDLEFITDGTIALGDVPYGRTLDVTKFRGSGTQSGEHVYRITDSGIEVFPDLAPGSFGQSFTAEQISSGVTEIDQLMGGGLERGTISVISGPTGVGKTTLGTQFMKQAAERGERSIVYLFEENRHTFLTRSEAVGIPVTEMLDRGTLDIVEVEALEKSPQEFASMVRRDVEENDAQIVMLDGISGYRLTLRGRREAMLQRLHALGRYLKNMGVTGIFVEETAAVTGEFTATDDDISYLADNIVFLRHLEVRGELRKAIGVLKKRTSDFERRLREFAITSDGLVVGKPLTQMRGIMRGVPELLDEADDTQE
jgi:circadian clock protein KaiC